MDTKLPQCQKCNTGVLLPLSDYGREGASVHYKAWVCSNPECDYHLRIDNGEISFGKALEPYAPREARPSPKSSWGRDESSFNR